MIKFIFKIIFNFLFFKAFNSNSKKFVKFFLHSDFSVFFFIFIVFFFFCAIVFTFLCFYFLFKTLKIFRPILTFFSLLKNNFYIWFLNHFFSIFLDGLFFFHKIRFVLFFGTGYFDPLSKILMDRISILKGELLMDFYNFSNKFIFENSFNIPISIFAYTPFFESSKNFYYVKIFYNLQHNLIHIQNKSRTYFYFCFQKYSFLSRSQVEYNNSVSSFPKHIGSSFFLVLNKIFLSLIFFFLNFFSSDFFILLNRINLFILFNSSFSIFDVLFLKYFSYLRKCFTFLLINLEHDSFLNYIQIFLYKLSLRKYFPRDEWDNMFNTYDLQFTNTYPFQGSKKLDSFLFFKVTYFYLFIYLNYCIFLFFFVLLIIFKFFYFLFFYTSRFFNIYVNAFFFFFNLIDFLHFFFFHILLIFLSFLRNYYLPHFKDFFLILKKLRSF